MRDDERAALEAFMASDPMLQEAANQEMERRKSGYQEPHMSQAKEVLPPLPKQVKPLSIYRASELYGKKLERPPIIIDNMIPAGLIVLAGAPKRGKSWMALKMAMCVAEGDPFFNFKCRAGAVLYLDLESRDYRVQDRMKKLIAGPGPKNLFFAHEAERLDGCLLEQLKSWIDATENPAMIIIDTLGRVKGGTKRGENAYESDTRIFGQLQSFALEHKIAIVCVHHLRKSSGDNADYFERISGSMGITGACDAVMVLAGKRGEEASVLRSSSRDFEAQDFVVRFDGGNWTLVSCDSEQYQELKEYNNSPVVRGVIAVAHKYGTWSGSMSDLMEDASELLGEAVPILRVNEFGREIQRFSEMLVNRDNVSIKTRRISKGRRKVIIESTVRQTEMRIEP